MTKAFGIVAYTYRADMYHPECIVAQLPTGDGEEFDGWGISERYPETVTVEANLSEIATAFGIDRMNEHSFDSGDFPKVVFSSQIEDSEFCGACGSEIDA